MLDEAKRLREAVVSSICNEQFGRLSGLLTRLARLQVDVAVLPEHGQGLGHSQGT